MFLAELKSLKTVDDSKGTVLELLNTFQLSFYPNINYYTTEKEPLAENNWQDFIPVLSTSLRQFSLATSKDNSN